MSRFNWTPVRGFPRPPEPPQPTVGPIAAGRCAKPVEPQEAP